MPAKCIKRTAKWPHRADRPDGFAELQETNSTISLADPITWSRGWSPSKPAILVRVGRERPIGSGIDDDVQLAGLIVVRPAVAGDRRRLFQIVFQVCRLAARLMSKKYYDLMDRSYRSVRPTVSIGADLSAFGDDQTGRGALSIVFGVQFGGHMTGVSRTHAGQWGHNDPVRQLQFAL
jgi:hypothetical protein